MKIHKRILYFLGIMIMIIGGAVYSFLNFTTSNLPKALYAKSYIQNNNAYYMGDTKYMVLRKSGLYETYEEFVDAIEGEGLEKTTDGVTDFYVYNDNNGAKKKIEALVDSSTPGSYMIIKINDY